MSDSIKHECGIAMIRLLKPVDFYLKKYGSAFYGLNKMHLPTETGEPPLGHATKWAGDVEKG